MITHDSRSILGWDRIPRRAPNGAVGGSSGDPHSTAPKENDQLRNQLGLAILRAAKKGDATTLQLLLDNGAPVNFVDPVDHATALHYAAAYDACPALRVLLKSSKCDCLVRDWEGRLPSEIAREYGLDYAMSRLLLIKEVRQVQAQGIDPGTLYKISARKAPP